MCIMDVMSWSFVAFFPDSAYIRVLYIYARMCVYAWVNRWAACCFPSHPRLLLFFFCTLAGDMRCNLCCAHRASTLICHCLCPACLRGSFLTIFYFYHFFFHSLLRGSPLLLQFCKEYIYEYFFLCFAVAVALNDR